MGRKTLVNAGRLDVIYLGACSTVDDHLFEKRQNPFGAKFMEPRCEQEQSVGGGDDRHLALLLINEYDR